MGGVPVQTCAAFRLGSDSLPHRRAVLCWSVSSCCAMAFVYGKGLKMHYAFMNCEDDLLGCQQQCMSRRLHGVHLDLDYLQEGAASMPNSDCSNLWFGMRGCSLFALSCDAMLSWGITRQLLLTGFTTAGCFKCWAAVMHLDALPVPLYCTYKAGW